MRQFISMHRTADEVVEVRVVVGGRLIISRVNHTHLARIRQTLAAIERIRSDAVRIGLFEIALNPASVSRDFLVTAATAPVDATASAASRPAQNWRGSGVADDYSPRFA